MSEKIEPVAWAMTDYQPEANTQYTGDKYAAEHWGSQGIQIEPLFSATTVSALEAEVASQSEQMEVVSRYLQKVSPWSVSNDMLWCDEVMVGIDLLMQQHDELKAAITSYLDGRKWYNPLYANKQQYDEFAAIEKRLVAVLTGATK